MIMRYLLLLIIVFTTSVCSHADVVKFEKKGRFGLKNTSTGKVVQKADYVSIEETEGGYYILSLRPKIST